MLQTGASFALESSSSRKLACNSRKAGLRPCWINKQQKHFKTAWFQSQTEYKPAKTWSDESTDVSQSRLKWQASSVRVGEMCLRVGADDAGPVL